MQAICKILKSINCLKKYLDDLDLNIFLMEYLKCGQGFFGTGGKHKRKSFPSFKDENG
jgi:hypothetical protein